MTSAASRREFLRAASGLAAALPAAAHTTPLALSLASLATLGAHSAAQAQASDYRALVCLFMAGGNDSHNWLLPADAVSYRAYAGARGDLAVPMSRIQPIGNLAPLRGRSLGMPTELRSLKARYDQRQLAWVANVGPLVRPITRAEYFAEQAVPVKLFSHNDQQSTWQSLSPEGARSGWGGRLGDVLMSANPLPVFTAVSAAGNAVFLSGSQVRQYQIGLDGPVAVNGASESWLMGSPVAGSILARVMADGSSSTVAAEYAQVVARGQSALATLGAAYRTVVMPPLPTTPVSFLASTTGPLSQEPLIRQLRVVAQMMAAGRALGMRRQVFMVQMGGFDTHANQARDQPGLMTRVDLSVEYFLNAIAGLGLLNQTVLFSASEFGRTLTSNGSGTDHGWGGHHFVVGGAVRGGAVYGQMPVVALNTPEDIGSGRLLPTTGVSELGATLGSWMGASAADIRYVLPNIGSFSRTTLGFV